MSETIIELTGNRPSKTLNIVGRLENYHLEPLRSDEGIDIQTDIKAIHIGSSVTSIGEAAFQAFHNLNFVHIPNTVTSIGNYAFQLYICYMKLI